MANSSHASAPSLLKFSGQRGWGEQRRWGLWAEGLAGGGGCGLRGDWAEGAMEVSLPCLVDGDVTHQLGFCFKTFTAEVTQLSGSVRVLRNDMFGEF